MVKTVLKRFLKGFAAGGVSSMLVVLNSPIGIAGLADFKMLASALLVAFLTGGLLAIEKAVTWKDQPVLTE